MRKVEINSITFKVIYATFVVAVDAAEYADPSFMLDFKFTSIDEYC